MLTITREGNRLFAQVSDQPKVEIYPKSELDYFCKLVNVEAKFVKDQSGKVTKLLLKQSGATTEAPRIN